MEIRIIERGMMMKANKLYDEIPLTETALLILLAMYEPNHGYGVMQMVEEMTSGRVNFGPGTLYGAINNLNKKGWISLVNVDKESRKKEYVSTDIGKRLVYLELERMKQVYDEGVKIMEKVGGRNDN